MLKDNLKTLRKNKGLSQEELSIKLHVVRQTVSKWESGLSVPDAEMLMTISEIFETPVSFPSLYIFSKIGTAFSPKFIIFL